MLTASMIILAVSFAADPAQETSFPLQKAAAEHPMHASIRSLVGRWETADDDNDGAPDFICEYRTTAGGSVVVETLFPGHEHEMVTLYHLDGDAIGVTHYCMMGNQPYMKSVADSTPRRISFECAGGVNIDRAHGDYMGSLVLEIGADGKTLTHRWGHFAEGELAGEMVFEFKRVK